MNYQPIISTTCTYSDNRGVYQVCKGKVILIEIVFTEEIYPSENPMLNFYPIIISEEEGMMEGDLVFNKLNHINKSGEILQVHPTKVEEFNEQADVFKKILALPEHFSPTEAKKLNNGKIGGGDEFLVKCKKMSEMKVAGLETSFRIDHYRVDLDQQNHVTLFSEKRYSTDCSLGVGDGDGKLFVYGSYEAIKRVRDMIFELEEYRSC